MSGLYIYSVNICWNTHELESFILPCQQYLRHDRTSTLFPVFTNHSAHSIYRQRIYNRLYECSCLIYYYVILYVINDNLTLVYKSRNCDFFLINVQNIYLDNYILCQNIIVVTHSLHTWNVYVTNNAFMKTWNWNTFICVNMFIDILNLVVAWLTDW